MVCSAAAFHNPDQLVAMPVFYQGELIAWTAALVHTTETGASEPGGMPIGTAGRVVCLLSGGIDSAVVAAIAVDALGPDRVADAMRNVSGVTLE